MRIRLKSLFTLLLNIKKRESLKIKKKITIFSYQLYFSCGEFKYNILFRSIVIWYFNCVKILRYSILCENIAILCCIRITILIFIYLFIFEISYHNSYKKETQWIFIFWFVLGTVMHNYTNKRKEKVCVYVFGSFCPFGRDVQKLIFSF